MNPIFDIIKKRRSIGKLVAPAPSQDELLSLFELSLAAPDHKLLRPYRFVVLGEESKQTLSKLLCQAAQDKADQEGTTLLEQEKNKLLLAHERAPMIVVCISDFKSHDKVPAFEQLLTIGACVQNFLLGLESLGYQSFWRSGAFMNAPLVRQHFGVVDDNLIVGFIYIGSSDIVMPERERLDVQSFVEFCQ